MFICSKEELLFFVPAVVFVLVRGGEYSQWPAVEDDDGWSRSPVVAGDCPVAAAAAMASAAAGYPGGY